LSQGHYLLSLSQGNLKRMISILEVTKQANLLIYVG